MPDQRDRLIPALADRYRIERELGQGGMATVYLAHDVKHDRRVALKVLKPELAAVLGADRFLAEIKVTANLQHPHILGLIDSGEADALLYYVMPFVEGESLRDRLTREKQLPIGDAVRIATEVASALDYAHRHGVIHRDIKPENVLLHDGQALVADFGIALAVSAAGGSRMTETGMSLGTPHYMSPEQAMGEREITAKADVYALGVVLYEMLAGEPPFTGATAQAIVARVVTEQPRPLLPQRHTIPAHVEAAVLQALEKLPPDRFASAAQFAEALARTDFASAVTRATPTPARDATVVSRIRKLVPWALLVVSATAAAWGWWRRDAAAGILRFGVVIPDSVGLRTDHNGTSIALAPDGSRVVFVGRSEGGRRMLFVRRFDQLDPQPLAGTEDAESPFFSPDGRWVAFFAESRLKKVALAGGPPLTIADASSGRGGTWGPNDVIVFSPTSIGGLMRVSAAGGPVDTVSVMVGDSGETSHRLPEFLPDGEAVVFTIQYGSRYNLAVVSLRDRAVRRLLEQGTRPRYATTGHLLYASPTGALLAVPFDARRRAVTGAPVSLLEGILLKITSGAAEYSVSRTGALAYLTGSAARRSLVLVDRVGRERVLTELVAGASPRFAPDGRRIVLTSLEQGSSDVRVYDLERGTLTRLTLEGASSYPEWTPDGRRIVYNTTRAGTTLGNDLFWVPVDGSAEATPLLIAPHAQWEAVWAPDGRSLVVRQSVPHTNRDLMVMSVDSPRTLRPYLVTSFEERAPAMAPDGRWLAYVSNESGRDEVYVRAYPNPAGRWQVSVAGGLEPRWAPGGGELFYRNGDSVIAVAVSSRPTFSMGSRRTLFVRSYSSDPNHAQYDPHPDNRRFVMFRSGLERSTVILTLHWFDELRARMLAGRAQAAR